MSSTYIITCPKDKKTKVEMNFAGNNGYVGVCGTCKQFLYYCSIFSRVDFLDITKEHYDLSFNDMTLKIDENI